jgi:hypothetical protein
MNTRVERTAQLRGLRALIVTTLVLLTAQGWFGDTVNIFIAPPNGTARPAATVSDFLHAVGSLQPPFFLVWHTFEGLALVVLALAVAILSFFWSPSKGVRMCAVLGLLFTLLAALGGYLFVMSGFKDGASSAQMGGSFIGSYALYFLTLYYTK